MLLLSTFGGANSSLFPLQLGRLATMKAEICNCFANYQIQNGVKVKKVIDAKKPLTIKIEEDIEEVEVKFWLDDALAYHNKLLVSDVPF